MILSGWRETGYSQLKIEAPGKRTERPTFSSRTKIAEHDDYDRESHYNQQSKSTTNEGLVKILQRTKNNYKKQVTYKISLLNI